MLPSVIVAYNREMLDLCGPDALNIPILQEIIHSYSSNSSLQLSRDAAEDLARNLRKMVNDPTFSDVHFVLSDVSDAFNDLENFPTNENNKIFGHRFLIQPRFDYFNRLLGGKLAESRQKEIRMNDTNRSTFLSLLCYMYSDSLMVHSFGPEGSQSQGMF